METPGTMAERGDAYVAAWPTTVAHRRGLSCEYTAVAMRRAGIVTDEADCHRLQAAFRQREATPEVAALTRETTRQVLAELDAAADRIRAAAQSTDNERPQR